MAYRQSPPQQSSAEHAELDAYEAQLIRRSKRTKTFMAVFLTLLLIIGLGSCFGPIGAAIAEDAWDNRHVSLTAAEQKQVDDALGPVESSAKKSQAAFDAIWPKIKNREIGARKDLGRCTASVPGPVIENKESSRSLEDSAGAYGWTFIDVTPSDARSPIGTLKMPRGSFALNNTGYGDRYVLPPAQLKTASPEKAPILASTSTADRAASLREEVKTVRAKSKNELLLRVNHFGDEGMGIDVVVFLDFWQDPKMTYEMAPTPPPPKDDDPEAWTRPTPRPARLFDAGFAGAHAVAWDPSKQQVVCASQAVAMSSEHITFRSDQLEPLQQDLVLELERALQRAFVAAGDAPPELERPQKR
jgi:hypothetical protein